MGKNRCSYHFFVFVAYITFCFDLLFSFLSTQQSMIKHKSKGMVRKCVDPLLQIVHQNILEHTTSYYRFLVFPMNGNGSKGSNISPYHWTLLVYDVEHKCWRHYNSLLDRGRDTHLGDAVAVVRY